MKHLDKDYIFPLITAGADILEAVPQYNQVIDRLIELESQVKKADASFDMANMWTCSFINGQFIFDITMHCRDLILKNKLLDIFCNAMVL